jgi:hypothetical protein
MLIQGLPLAISSLVNATLKSHEGNDMNVKLRYILSITLLVLGALLAARHMAAQSGLTIKAEDVMTAQELKDTGLSGLTAAQRKAFDEWLIRYSTRLYNIAANQGREPASRPSVARNSCAPAVESTISGEFRGWEGETIFKLSNGQIWQQAEYDYNYTYSYQPEVTIYEVGGGCRMKVEDEEETIMVKRIK